MAVYKRIKKYGHNGQRWSDKKDEVSLKNSDNENSDF